ncbi:uncharacterized protein EV154DRAFT_430334 [Mucor mucedo]|uniref:uncharacterized protein n=1 Tax=Mucor mucedo TaxID=29922 RepID=UPI00221F17F6|nr:uncharacterized protein EV154DRAFT_430334 [Mucor mucedo]KAI7874617.1 hypothetical protein EV154DRAFT_430334 [Mucor mucedo]
MNSLYQVDELVKEYLLVEKIIEELLGAIANGDIQALIDYYRYLDVRFFSRLDSRFQPLPYIKNPSNDSTFETFFSKQWVDNYTISLHNFLATTFQNMRNLLSFNIDRIQRKTQQGEIETLKSTVENQKATLESRENDIAKLKHQVAETRKEMTDGISMIRRRAASSSTDHHLLKPTTSTALPRKSNSESTQHLAPIEHEEPFLIVSQDEFAEHASAITHAKFSSEGELIASCDMDNIVRIWSYKGQSFNPLKIKNTSSNVLSLEWDARSDRFVKFIMDDHYPWVNQLSSSPIEPIFVCAGSGNKIHPGSNTSSSALVAWSMKTMSACLNHNGQMLVAGDTDGLMRIFGKS